MTVNILPISKEQFFSHHNHLFYHENLEQNQYAIITNGIYEFSIAWHSKLVNPVMLEVIPNIYGIGIDQDFAILNFDTGIMVMHKLLPYFFYDIKIFKSYFFVITELLILVYDKNSYEQVAESHLPDFYQRIEFGSDKWIVTCLNLERVVLPYP